MAYVKRKNEFCGMGAVVQAIGLVLCLTLVGAIIGVPMLIIGSRMATKYVCSECGNGVADNKVKMCPVCHSQF